MSRKSRRKAKAKRPKQTEPKAEPLANPVYGTPEFWARVSEATKRERAQKAAFAKKGRAWPQKSVALSCHPSQVKAMNAAMAKQGLSVTYAADGTCVIPDRNERKKLLKAEGFYDKDGGYSDG